MFYCRVANLKWGLLSGPRPIPHPACLVLCFGARSASSSRPDFEFGVCTRWTFENLQLPRTLLSSSSFFPILGMHHHSCLFLGQQSVTALVNRKIEGRRLVLGS